MSFSDLTRSYTTFPASSATSSSSPASRSSSSLSTPASYSYTSPATSTAYSYASEGPSNVPGRSIGASASAVVPSVTPHKGGLDEGLALGLGLGLGFGAVLTVLAILFVFRQRRAQRADFEQRAEVIRTKMDAAQVNQGRMREARE